jgi:hypothetical protein
MVKNHQSSPYSPDITAKYISSKLNLVVESFKTLEDGSELTDLALLTDLSQNNCLKHQ